MGRRGGGFCERGREGFEEGGGLGVDTSQNSGTGRLWVGIGVGGGGGGGGRCTREQADYQAESNKTVCSRVGVRPPGHAGSDSQTQVSERQTCKQIKLCEGRRI